MKYSLIYTSFVLIEQTDFDVKFETFNTLGEYKNMLHVGG